MKPILRIALFGAIIFIQGCGGCIKKIGTADSEQSLKGKSKIPVPDATSNLTINDEKDLPGYWVGTFGPPAADSTEYYDSDNADNKINISIDDITGTKVKGHTVIAGKVRFFTCEMQKKGSRYSFKFKGGADEKVDGLFKFGISAGDSLMKGTWTANSEKAMNHEYSLAKKHFAYNADWKLQRTAYVDYSKSRMIKHKADSGEVYNESRFATTSEDIEKINASAELLKRENIANLKKADFLVIRNSIFARHGYTFKKPLLSRYFSQQSWYVPISNDVTADITPLEKKNLALMARYEKNAEEYYNAYGR